jgi:lipoprotein-anchoring transpeptidase ErfK/SrfK
MWAASPIARSPGTLAADDRCAQRASVGEDMFLCDCGAFRRRVLAFLPIGGVLLLSGCLAAGPIGQINRPASEVTAPRSIAAYGPIQDGKFLIPAVNVAQVDPKFLRQNVSLPVGIPNDPSTIVVDPKNRFLYLVMENGRALRYGVGVGRQGFAWSGTASIHHAGKWPKWFPPAEMVKRDPKAAQFRAGMAGGLDNPLGARALYLFQGARDTLYRIHGTNDPSSIGKAASSGCIRLFNQDIIDLYSRVPEETKVIVLPAGPAPNVS